MQKAGIYDKVKDKFVLGENISQTASFVMSGSFVNGCTGCHRPLYGNDYVYTLPISPAKVDREQVVNNAAALPANLQYQPLNWSAITMYVDPKTRTMATLYGNDAAMRGALAGQAAPAGAVVHQAIRAGLLLSRNLCKTRAVRPRRGVACLRRLYGHVISKDEPEGIVVPAIGGADRLPAFEGGVERESIELRIHRFQRDTRWNSGRNRGRVTLHAITPQWSATLPLQD